MPNIAPNDLKFIIDTFNEIRDRPFRVSTEIGKKSDNCYFKSIELVQTFMTIGFTMRFRSGEMNWDAFPAPEEILNLRSEETPHTHFYPEILWGDEWHLIDPTLSKSFAQKFDLPYSEIGKNNECAFEITDLYDEPRHRTTFINWLTNKRSTENYFEKNKQFLTELNGWLTEVNP